MKCVIVVLIWNLAIIFAGPISKTNIHCNFQTRCHSVDPTKLTIHIVPHSHDDVGWLKTVDEYYEGDSRYPSVRKIISSTLEELKKNQDRRYIQVETAYFWKWWQEQDSETQNDYRNMVANGQLEIINGAWAMNDEAAAHYQSIIDQYTWGLRIINDTLGACGIPKVGWQIDPFGHSREHVSILSQLGFYGLFVNRVDFRDLKNRKDTKNMDFVWQSSSSLENSNMFTGMFPDFYTSPKGFCLDSACGDRVTKGNRERKKKEFTTLVQKYSQYYRTNNVIVPLGGDFHFQHAKVNFESIDNLIETFADDENIQVIYSTPSCYIKAVNEESLKNNVAYKLKTDDFFPYASSGKDFWTGYYTSRPNSKRNERMGNNILQATKQLASLSRMRGKDYDETLISLREAMGIMQHHDAITGTEKQHVAEDYARLIFKGINSAEEPVGAIIGNLLSKEDGFESIDLGIKSCLLSNISICETSKWDHFIVAVYNPLSRPVSHYVRLPVNGSSYIIKGPKGQEKSDVIKIASDFKNAFDTRLYTASQKELVFKAEDLPPLGIKLYFVYKATSKESDVQEVNTNDVFGTERTGFEMDFDTNLLKSVTINGKKLSITQEFLVYKSSDNWRPSGAYQFVPSGEASGIGKPQIKYMFKGNLVDEVHQVINDEIVQIIRVYKDDEVNNIEFDWVVGPIDGSTGKEFITRFTVNEDFNTDGYFYTDSNGRELLKRKRDYRSDFDYDAHIQPISGNYYPVPSKIVIRDESRKIEIAVLNDRSQGGTSLKDNQIELMIHRRLHHDDGWGVQQSLSENEFNGKGVVVRGRHYLIFGSTELKAGEHSISTQERHLAEEILLAPLIFVGGISEDSAEEIQKSLHLEFSGIVQDFPENIHIMTLEPWKDDSYLLRLEHFLEKNEDLSLSVPTTIDLKNIVRSFSISEIRETTLGGNEWLDEHDQEEKFSWIVDGVSDAEKEINKEVAYVSIHNMKISLSPMQIRTFIFKVNKTNDSHIYSSKGKFSVKIGNAVVSQEEPVIGASSQHIARSDVTFNVKEHTSGIIAPATVKGSLNSSNVMEPYKLYILLLTLMYYLY